MKKLILIASVIAVFLVSLPGCGTVLITAPPESNIRLLAELEPATSKVTVKNWYVVWGLVPLTNNNTSDIIAKHALKNVRVKTYFGFMDVVVNYVLGGLSIYTNTVDIEGNLSK